MREEVGKQVVRQEANVALCAVVEHESGSDGRLVLTPPAVPSFVRHDRRSVRDSHVETLSGACFSVQDARQFGSRGGEIGARSRPS